MKRTSLNEEKSSTAEDSSSFSEKMSSSQNIPRNEVKKVLFKCGQEFDPLVDAMTDLKEAVIELREEITIQHNTSSDSTVEDKDEELEEKRKNEIVQCAHIFKKNARIYYRTRQMRVVLWTIAISIFLLSCSIAHASINGNLPATPINICLHWIFVFMSVGYGVYDVLIIGEDMSDHQKAMNENFFQAQTLCKNINEKKNIASDLFSTGKYHSCYESDRKLHNTSFY